MNKKEFLKIAKVKTIDEFYKKFPDEESFIKAHGKEFKKAMRGSKVEKAQGGRNLPTGAQMSQQLMTDFPLAQAPDIDSMMKPVNVPSGALKQKSGVGMKGMGATQYIEPLMGVIEGASMIKGQREKVRQARQNKELTGVQAQAAESVPFQQTKRQYIRPEDTVFQPEQMFPSYGAGPINVLAEDGAVIGGNPTEIMNTFAPNTIYTDMGYEPLNDSSKLKQFAAGGGLNATLNSGKFGDFMSGGGGDVLGTIGNAITGEPDAGTKIGGGIGQAAGMIFGGPVGGMIGKFAGSLIGDAIDQSERKIEAYNEQSAENVGRIVGQQAGVQIQNMFGLKNGGEVSDYQWISHTWQPQVITHFGEHKLSDLLKPPHDADMLRAGGHLKAYTPPNPAAMFTGRPDLAFGGELQTTWGGYAEPISYNPYMPATGQTVMFKGKTHEDGGIGVVYGKEKIEGNGYAINGAKARADVEVETNEPASEMTDGNGEKSMVVYGNLKIPNQFLHEIGDPKAKGKKFKTYVNDLAKKEQRQNKIIDKSSEKLDELNPQSPFDMLKFNALAANIKGANMKLKQYADFKQNAAAVQNAINDTSEELGLVADDLARGKVKQAKQGISLRKAQDGLKTELGESITEDQLKELNSLYEAAKSQKTGDAVLAFQRKFHEYLPKAALRYNKETKFLTAKAKKLGVKKEDLDKIDPNNLSGNLEKLVLQGNEDKYFGPITTKYMEIAKASTKKPTPTVLPKVDPRTGAPTPTTIPTTTDYPITPYKKNPYLEAIAAALPKLRPSDVESLDPNQLVGEMYALSTNQVEPVWAQQLRPRLNVPYDISLQDILNENQANFNAIQRITGYNPAAQSALAAQKYAANQKVLGEQFRLNQAMKDKVYSENRNILNQYDLANMGILDKQYERQATALSKTKATTQEALNSIASKIAQNKLENRTLATYENLYGYRFDPRFRAQNFQTAAFNIPTVYAGPDGKVYNINQSTSGTPSSATPPIVPTNTVPENTYDQIDWQTQPSASLAKTGKKISKKEQRNSSIVKALKNL